MFNRKPKTIEWVVPTSKTDYPDGTFASTEGGLWYLQKPGVRRRFITERVLNSWSPQKVIQTSEAAINHYKAFGKMRFRPGSLIKNVADGKMYYISDTVRRHIQNPDVLVLLNRTESDCVLVSNEEANLHEDGEILN